MTRRGSRAAAAAAVVGDVWCRWDSGGDGGAPEQLDELD